MTLENSGDNPSNDFESALAALESIVRELEDPEMGLESSLKRYEEGILLAKDCLKRLDEAELKIQTLRIEDTPA